MSEVKKDHSDIVSEDQQQSNKPVSQAYSISQPNQALQLANELSSYVEKQGLSITISNNKYVLVEGWQFALSQLGVVPMITKTIDHSTREEVTFIIQKALYNNGKKTGEFLEKRINTKIYKHEAVCELVKIETGQIVGRGFAICTNEESSKHEFDEYAIQSMAQTRSIGKAARLLIGWLMKAAGYQSTPAEEMHEEMDVKESKSAKKQKLVFDENVKKKANSFRTVAGLIEWASGEELKDIQSDEEFRKYILKRREELSNRAAKAKSTKSTKTKSNGKK